MKLTLKITILILIVTIIPLIILGTIASNDAKNIGESTAKDAKELGETTLSTTINMGNNLMDLAKVSLNHFGEEIIKQKAEDVAKQLEIYIKNKPNWTIEDFQKNELFSSIAVQPVGETGYTAVTDVNSLICRFHASPKIINFDLHNLAGPLPGFWAIMSQTEGGKIAEGYYDWKEPDNSTREKYMYIAIVDAKTADGIQLSVAATTYIDEFTQPIVEAEEKITSDIEKAKANIATANSETLTKVESRTKNLSLSNTIFTITIITILVAFALSILLSRNITKPVLSLTKTANSVMNGDLDAKVEVRTKDEIMDLAAAMESLISSVKYLKKEQRQNKEITENKNSFPEENNNNQIQNNEGIKNYNENIVPPKKDDDLNIPKNNENNQPLQ